MHKNDIPIIIKIKVNIAAVVKVMIRSSP